MPTLKPLSEIPRYFDDAGEPVPEKTLGQCDLPIQTTGDRVIVLVKPPASKTRSALFIPDTAQQKNFIGRILTAGLSALDKLHDHGYEIGDEVWFGKFAGVIELWTHITKPGDGKCKSHEWRFHSRIEGRPTTYRCDNCGAILSEDPIVVINADDLLGSVELAERLRSGRAEIVQGRTDAGRTQFVLERKE